MSLLFLGMRVIVEGFRDVTGAGLHTIVGIYNNMLTKYLAYYTLKSNSV